VKTLKFLFVVLVFASCKSKIYHNITAHYNGYYNATERMKTAIQTLQRSNVDDYDKVLSVFQFADEAKSRAVQPDMDEIFKKAGTIVQKHGPSKWVDNSYLLIAKTHFFKRDYYSAIEVFQYINDRYKNTQESYEATIWIMICKLMLKKNDEAFSVASSLKTDLDYFNEQNKALYYATLAEYYIRQQEYIQAQKNIGKALKYAEGRTYRTRLKFILAQLYQRNGKVNQAILNYQAVIKRNPPYEMAFNAKLNIGRTYDPAKPESLKLAKSNLKAMAKDDKNLAYLDKIYYELGNIEMLEGNKDQAIAYYKLSLLNFKDQNTKALTYLKLADLYFKLPDYPLAQAYYDSTGMFLSSKYEGYDKLIAKKKVLSEIIKNLIVIQTEDSLQRLSKMSDAERKAIIDRYNKEKEKEKDKEDRKKKDEENNSVNNNNNTSPQNNNNYVQASGDEWYFYNPAAIAQGYSEFTKRWGSRNNEDYWFLLDRKSIGGGEQKPDDKKGNDNPTPDPKNPGKKVPEPKPSDKKKTVTEIKVPTTKEELEASNSRIIDAYVANGLIYKDKLNDTKEALKIFQTLLQRFPDNPYLAKVYYYMYKCYADLKDDAKANTYRDLVLSKFPESDYANIIRHTGDKSTAAGGSEDTRYYEATYELYKNNDFAEVIRRSDEAQTKFEGSNLLGKFDYLKALAIGKTQSEEKFKAQLEYIVKTYPNTDVYVAANNMLDYFKRKSAPEADMPSTAPYKNTPGAEHSYLLITDDKIDLDKLKIQFADYNAEYHRLESFTINTFLLNDKTKLVQVKPFENSAKAIEYYRELINNTLFFDKAGLVEYSQCVISNENFILLMKKKDDEEYLKFFQATFK
jgi:tetratricopeptide (TPR) repeat protein